MITVFRIYPGGVGTAINSWWTVAAGLVIVGALSAWGIRARLRRNRRRFRRKRAWPAFVGASLAALVTVAITMNTVTGYFPTVDALATRLGFGRPVATQPPAPRPSPTASGVLSTPAPSQGQGLLTTVTVPVPPELTMPESTTYIYTPPNMDHSGATIYPMLVLLHGQPGNSNSWFDTGLAEILDAEITSGRVRPMIVVAPSVIATDIEDASCLNSTQGGSQVETYLEQTLPTWLAEHYPISPNPAHRGIGGVSSGGYCALDQGLRHPENWATIIAMMPYDSPGEGGTHQLGPAADLSPYTPSAYIPTLTTASQVAVNFVLGSTESEKAVKECVQSVGDALRTQGATVQSDLIEGSGHDWTTARNALPGSLAFFDRHIQDAGTGP